MPVINIFDPLIKELASRSARRVAVFGTRYVMESGLFGLAGNVEIVPLSPDEVNQVHATYAELALTGRASNEQHEKLTAIAHTLLARDSVEAIILAGTDLALLFNESNTDFPHIDCAALHIQEILQNLQ